MDSESQNAPQIHGYFTWFVPPLIRVWNGYVGTYGECQYTCADGMPV